MHTTCEFSVVNLICNKVKLFQLCFHGLISDWHQIHGGPPYVYVHQIQLLQDFRLRECEEAHGFSARAIYFVQKGALNIIFKYSNVWLILKGPPFYLERQSNWGSHPASRRFQILAASQVAEKPGKVSLKCTHQICFPSRNTMSSHNSIFSRLHVGWTIPLLNCNPRAQAFL